MTETYSELKDDDDNGPLGRIGRLIAKRWAQEDLEYEKLVARQNRPTQTEADLARIQRGRGRIMELQERISKRAQQPLPSREAEYDPDDAVPEWMRSQWDEHAKAAGCAALGVVSPELIAIDVQSGATSQEQLGLS